MNFRGSHDQAQNDDQGRHALGFTKVQQVQIPQATCTGIIEASSAARHKACPHHCNAADANGRNDRIDRRRNGLAAAFGPGLSCRCRPQETRAQSCFRANRQRSCLSHQGWQSFTCSRGPGQAGGLMRCIRNVAMVAPRPKRLLRTRSRICAVSISERFVRAGRASSRERPQTSVVTVLKRGVRTWRQVLPSHWEGDLLSGPNNSYIATLVERHTRYVMLAKVAGKDTQTVVSALIKQAKKLPKELYKSLTEYQTSDGDERRVPAGS